KADATGRLDDEHAEHLAVAGDRGTNVSGELGAQPLHRALGDRDGWTGGERAGHPRGQWIQQIQSGDASVHRRSSGYNHHMNANVAKCLRISKVLVADGMMADDEKEFLSGMMNKLGLTDAEQKSVIELEKWDEAEPIVKALSDDEKQEIVELL